MPKYILVRASWAEKLSENFGKPAIDKVKGFIHVGFSPDFSPADVYWDSNGAPVCTGHHRHLYSAVTKSLITRGISLGNTLNVFQEEHH